MSISVIGPALRSESLDTPALIYAPFDIQLSHVLLLLNGVLLGVYALLHMEYLAPARALMQQAMSLTLAKHTPMHSLRDIAPWLISHTSDLAREQAALRKQLGESQLRIGTLMHTQKNLNSGAFNETLQVFATIQSYAQYLEDMVMRKRADESLRYDYDEVCEAAANLQFLMQGMQYLLEQEKQSSLRSTACNAVAMIGQFLLQVTPLLERRSMRITSRQFPGQLSLYTQEGPFKHLLWALLYVCLRYAESDSTLNLEGREGDTEIWLRFYVTHSNPSSLSSKERESYLSALTNSDHSVHMFSHAISQHANMQLASKLAACLGGTVDCIPQGPYCCMLELRLPKVLARE